MKHQCPVCRKPVTENSAKAQYFPFCSSRCQLVDLDAWLEADYRIISKSTEPRDEETEYDSDFYGKTSS
jgi:hypothetical protein